MAKHESLDELITKHAAELAEHVRAAAQIADKEEEIRIEVERQLAFLQRAAGIKLEGKHEFTVASGRADSVYQTVVIEYKNPSSAASRIGETLESPGTRRVVEQIKTRFRDLQTEYGHPIERLFGVGCDGNRFVFVRWRDKKWEVQPPVEVDKFSAERFLWALFNLGSKGKAYRPEYLAGDFGSESPLAQTGIKVLYDAILGATHPKAKTFFNQWKILFGEVCGFDVDDPSDKIKKLAAFYNVGGKKVHAAELLFAVHTYYAVFMKLLAAAIVARFHKMPGDPLSRLHAAANPTKFKHEMEELEKGSVFRHFNITNFLEGDLFAWYLPEWSDEVHGFLKGMVDRLDDYNPQTLAEEPSVSRDLLKKLYQELFPKSVRHDLGEYYTPDWLAEHTLNEVGYDGDPEKRVLDPACGSGTFLVMAINRVRRWYEDNREKVGYEEADLARKILTNIVGFDLNPLAVMAARTNYLIAIRGLISGLASVEIPVYLCDSVILPKVPGGPMHQIAGAKVKEVPTAVGPLPVAAEVVVPKSVIAAYCAILEDCISNHVAFSIFQNRCAAEGIPFQTIEAHERLFNSLMKLHASDENGVWARIVKNSFAPMFTGRSVDLVVGNPPWVNYENLPASYREASASDWERYDLFPKGGWRARFAKGNTELAMIFVYACMDYYLRKGGKLAFVITQSVFQSKDSGRGFRSFKISPEQPIQVLGVDDLTRFQPFEGAVNRTAVLTANLSETTSYPVRYRVWRKDNDFAFEDPLEKVLDATVREDHFAAPVGDEKSPWMVVPDKALFETLNKLSRGTIDYRAWKGADTRGGNGIFWLQPLKSSRGVVYCRNTPEFSKKKPPEREWGFEPDLIYPLLRGRETRRWRATPTICMLFPHEADRAIPADVLASDYPKTWAYLKSFKSELTKRRMYDLSRKELPFWSLFETGPFLMAPYKVVWKYVASALTCAVVDGHRVEGLTNRLIIPDHKLVIVPFKSKTEAHYVCAALNSAVARFLADTYIVGTQISTHILEFIKVPAFRTDDNTHTQLSAWSAECHKRAAKDDRSGVFECEAMVDTLAATLWGVTKKELKAIQRMQAAKAKRKEEDPE